MSSTTGADPRADSVAHGSTTSGTGFAHSPDSRCARSGTGRAGATRMSGTGESSLTWQAMTGVGYAFGWGDVTLAWRHIDYDMKSGKSIESVSFDGPGVAAAFRW